MLQTWSVATVLHAWMLGTVQSACEKQKRQKKLKTAPNALSSQSQGLSQKSSPQQPQQQQQWEQHMGRIGRGGDNPLSILTQALEASRADELVLDEVKSPSLFPQALERASQSLATIV